MSTLDREEREILDSYRAGKLERVVLSAEEIERYRDAARAVSRKDKRVNIRMSSIDLRDLQIRAMKEGIPYQTLMSSVLHKYVAGKLVAELSKGYRQRVGLAQAMLHDPDILILDEPTSGLDPNQIVEIRQLIKEIGREKTIILSTHILPEVQATCSRMIIISTMLEARASLGARKAT